MNREEWLQGLAVRLADELRLTGARGMTVLPSFPATSHRGGRVCDVVDDESGRMLGLVSPQVGDSLAVGVVVAYALSRAHVARVSRRLSRHQSERLARLGWRVNGWQVNPDDRMAEVLAASIDAYVAQVGPYPAAPVVARSAARQTTRMLALTCLQHPEVRVRATRSQIDAGAPMCGRDDRGRACGLRLQEVAA